MKPRSLTPLWRMPRSSSRSTAWANVACETAKARWWTHPGSVGVRLPSRSRPSSVKTVIRRPSPGSKYRWLSDSRSRLGCSNTNGMPSTPSQKSIDVCRSAPTIVMWWTPWVWSLRIAARSLPDRAPCRHPARLVSAHPLGGLRRVHGVHVLIARRRGVELGGALVPAHLVLVALAQRGGGALQRLLAGLVGALACGTLPAARQRCSLASLGDVLLRLHHDRSYPRTVGREPVQPPPSPSPSSAGTADMSTI